MIISNQLLARRAAGNIMNTCQIALHKLSCRGKFLVLLLPPTGGMIMQRVEVIIRYIDDEDQVLSESNLGIIGNMM